MPTEIPTPTDPTSAPTRTSTSRRHTRVVAACVLGVLALGGVTTAVLVSTATTSATAAPRPVASATSTAPAPVPAARVTAGNRVTPGAPVTPSHASTPVRPVTPPSPAVAVLQRELAQLNYYEGPIDGVTGPQTTAAITYLQRDAHLPQTGHMDPATAQALARFLADGNNQMGG